jgi:putative two-component system response regulator
MAERKKIILVDDDATNLIIGKNALSAYYDTITIPSGKKLFKVLDMIKPDLILLDVNMPEMDGYETLRRLKENPAHAGVPVIFLTATNDIDNEPKYRALGAIDCISKPFSPPLLRERIETHLGSIGSA